MTVMSLLQGLRVIEFSAFVAAPSAGLALAQLGAEVIRVDPIGGNIDIHRAPRNAAGRSLYWASLNRGKRSVELNVRSAEGRALLQQLIIAPGDGPAVFLTNLSVDGELSYAALAKLRPDVIVVQLSGSPDGSAAVDYTVNCAAGFPGITGSGRDGPVNHVLPAWDVIAGQMLALAVLAAERHWRLSGQGQHVKLALSDVAMATAANLGYLADVELNGTQRRADGNFLYGAYGDSFGTADGRHAMVVAITDRQWAALLRATGLHESLPKAAEALGHRLDSEDARYAARELISTALRPWFAQRTLADRQRRLQRPRAAVGPVPRLRANGGRGPARLGSEHHLPPHRASRRRHVPHRHHPAGFRRHAARATRSGAAAGRAHAGGTAAVAGVGRGCHAGAGRCRCHSANLKP